MTGAGSKQTISDLALFGGEPLFQRTLHVGRPNLPDREALLGRIGEILDRDWLTNNGPMVQELERRMADLLGVRNCVAMCNGTVALEIACRALGLGDEVIVPSFTFVATAHALQWQGIRPVFCDIDPATHCIDPAEVERHITPRTTGVIAVNLWAQACAVDELEAIAQRRGLALIFDSAQALMVSHRGRLVGGFGACEVLSFHATKVLNSFEGGAVTTNDDALAEKMRLMRNFGFAGLDNGIYLGINGKMTEVCAAMGLTSLDCVDSFIEANRRNYEAYRARVDPIPGLAVRTYDEGERTTYQYVVVTVGDEYGLSRDALMRVLHAENVRVRRYFWPGCHRMEPYRSYYPHAGLLLPNTEAVSERLLVFPTGPEVTLEDIDTIGRCLEFLSENGGRVAGKVPGDG